MILHYDACYSSHHCHQVLKASDFKGSHFYLDLDGTLYQTCDLYWKTNTAPAGRCMLKWPIWAGRRA